MIEVKKLKKIYKTVIKTGNPFTNFFNRQYTENKALEGISFDIEDNELIGFIGPNGAGKTTTLKILAGILYPTSGDVSVLGFTPFEKKPDLLKQIAFVMGQKNQMLWELPATDSFKLNKEIYEISDSEYSNTIGELSEILQVEKFINQPIKTLSLGQRMRVELIGALLHKPKVLFLDEPTIGLDIFAQTTIINFIREYQERYKSTIILTSHYMQDVQRLAKRVILIDHGSLIYDGKLQTLVEKHSFTKTVTIILSKKIDIKDIKLPAKVSAEYTYPQLKLSVPKDNIDETLHTLLPQIEYADMTIENEPLEEIIKKSFSDKT